LRSGDRERGHALADSALRESTRRGAPAGIAESLALVAFAAPVSARETASLEEAITIWRRIGNPLREACAVLGLASLGGHVSNSELESAQAVLRTRGVRLPASGAGLTAMLDVDRPEPLAIQTLGRFAVLRDGVPVPSAEWQSKKARDLLKLLVVRRGRPAPRDHFVELLWPDDDPKKSSNRLSVALNVVRGVLDPEGEFDPDHFVVGGREALRLELSHVVVDIEKFFEQAEAGLSLHRAGKTTEAVPLLEVAEAAYRGDFLEEDRYEDWAGPMRDETRSTYIDVARALAHALGGDAGLRYHLRILALDPYDEQTHLSLVSALTTFGRHGEARRAYRRYTTRMGEIGVEPAGFPPARTALDQA
jgi:DNA-binding SARP family transcriptional activator